MTNQVLNDAAELLSDPARWHKGSYAGNMLGEPVPTHDPEAVCWCLSGALVRSNSVNIGYIAHDEAYHALTTVVQDMGHSTIVKFNDHPETTHEMVMRVMDTAKEKLQ